MAVNSFNAQNPPVTTKGDVFTFSTIPTRLGVGANDTVLTADSSTATGLKWATPAAGANWTLVNSGGTALTGAATITVTGISSADKILVILEGASSASASADVGIRFNTNTGNNYYRFGAVIAGKSTYGANIVDAVGGASDRINLGSMSTNAGSVISGGLTLTGANTSGVKQFIAQGGATTSSGTGNSAWITQGYVNLSAAITSVSAWNDSGNFDAGTIYVYTSA